MSTTVITRGEREADVSTIRAIIEAAFGRALEGDIVDGIRGTADWWPDCSIVAVDQMRRIFGHVLLSRGRLVQADGSIVEIGVIGPVAVQPNFQRQGVGSQLMRAAISAAVARRLPVICLVGHPSYYPRFKFEPARPLGIESLDQNWPDEAWMALRLPGWMPSMRGVVHFPPAFGEESI